MHAFQSACDSLRLSSNKILKFPIHYSVFSIFKLNIDDCHIFSSYTAQLNLKFNLLKDDLWKEPFGKQVFEQGGRPWSSQAWVFYLKDICDTSSPLHNHSFCWETLAEFQKEGLGSAHFYIITRPFSEEYSTIKRLKLFFRQITVRQTKKSYL